MRKALNWKTFPCRGKELMSAEFKHISVLMAETLDALAIKPEGTYIDGTFGRGGHSGEILKRLTTGRLQAIDQDPQAIQAAQKFADDERFSIARSRFSNIKAVAEEAGILGQVDGILLDIGFLAAAG